MDDQSTLSYLVSNCSSAIQTRMTSHLAQWTPAQGHSQLAWIIRMLKDQNPRTPHTTRAIRGHLTILQMGRNTNFAQFMEKFLIQRTKLQKLVGHDEYSNGQVLRDYCLPRMPQGIGRQWMLAQPCIKCCQRIPGTAMVGYHQGHRTCIRNDANGRSDGSIQCYGRRPAKGHAVCILQGMWERRTLPAGLP